MEFKRDILYYTFPFTRDEVKIACLPICFIFFVIRVLGFRARKWANDFRFLSVSGLVCKSDGLLLLTVLCNYPLRKDKMGLKWLNNMFTHKVVFF